MAVVELDLQGVEAGPDLWDTGFAAASAGRGQLRLDFGL